MLNFDEQKNRIVDTCRILMERGYLKTTEGNISVRVPGQQAFAITPSNYDYAKMKMEDVCVLTDDLEQLEGKRKPSIESAMHAAVYQARPDVHAIIHPPALCQRSGDHE